jgi:hypothetical protein
MSLVGFGPPAEVDDEDVFHDTPDAFTQVEFATQVNGETVTYDLMLDLQDESFLFRPVGDETWAEMPVEVFDDALAFATAEVANIGQSVHDYEMRTHGEVTYGAFDVANLVPGVLSGATPFVLNYFLRQGTAFNQIISSAFGSRLLQYGVPSVKLALRTMSLFMTGNICETSINLAAVSAAVFCCYAMAAPVAQALNAKKGIERATRVFNNPLLQNKAKMIEQYCPGAQNPLTGATTTDPVQLLANIALSALGDDKCERAKRMFGETIAQDIAVMEGVKSAAAALVNSVGPIRRALEKGSAFVEEKVTLIKLTGDKLRHARSEFCKALNLK